MIFIETGLYVRIEEMEGDRAPMPKPLASGFIKEHAYRVLGVHSPAETSDAYLILSNERDELWFICNRHLRTVVVKEKGPFRLALTALL
ncbi:hypothetical protein [Oceanisphaera avium]|uniref:Uncharacterized protein n=1 Tax=Oceanisphaera avium TaxID=1903694 RepID=A0A1Y0CVE1_9GAMM|nr:hypothetical protein [Oceanisphaera avium]ART78867.1 hypothetical protein CBP12_00785 [Oceanisphaera avium]